MTSLSKWVDKSLDLFLVALLVAMVVSISGEIMLREIVGPLSHHPGWISAWSTPLNTLSQTLLVWVGLLGSALTWRARAHPSVDLVVASLPQKVQRALAFGQILVVGGFAFSVFIFGGYQVCSRALSTGSKMPGIENVNRAWFYSVLPLAGFAHLYYCVSHWRALRSASQRVMSPIEPED